MTVTWYDGSKDPHTEGDTLEACITRKARAVTRKRAIDEFNSRQHEEFKRFVEELDGT